MSDQGRTAQSPHDAAAAGIESMFLDIEAGGPAPQRQQQAPQAPEMQDPPQDGEDQDAADGEPQEGKPDEQEPLAPDPEETEVEIDGEKYLMPKKIAERFIHQADYTKKTQDLAELRRSVAAEQERIAVAQQFEQSVAAERQQAMMLDASLGQYKQLDWSQLGTEDLLRARAQFDQLKEQRAEIDKAIEAKRGEFQQRQQNATQEMLAAGQKYITQRVPGFNEKLRKELMEYGVSDGYQQDELAKVTDPRFIVTLHKAMQWDRLQASAPGIKNKAARAAPVIRPGATVKSPSRIQALAKGIKAAKDSRSKRAAGEEYFTALFGGG